VCRDPTSLVCVVFLRAALFPACGRLLPTDRDTIGGHDSLSSTSTPSPSLPWAAKLLLGMLEEPDWLAGCAAPPNLLTAAPLVTQALERSFRRRRLVLLGLLGGWLLRAGPLPAAQPASSPQEDLQSQVRGVCAPRWCLQTAQHRAGCGKPQVVAEEKLVRVGNLLRRPLLRRTASPKKSIFFSRLQKTAGGQRQRQRKKTAT